MNHYPCPGEVSSPEEINKNLIIGDYYHDCYKN
jgi:hypothetical protein